MPKIPTKLSSLVKARYQIRDNTFIRAAKDDPRDRIAVEIGDEKQPSTFYPQVKLKRWDNEINLSVRLKDDDYDTPTIQTSQDKIKWISGKREAHFYEIGASQDHPEGGYEFEVVLKEKPAINVVEFSIQTKGLEFLYQPALTPEEIERGCARPENVVGSYAAYYKDCPANYEGGKLYRVGKAFHIYRPKIEDAKGNWTWGELRVDEEQGTLAVTIPWEFLDEAVYPVRHAAGLTFGYTSKGSGNITLGSDVLRGSVFTGAAGTASKISFFGYSANGTVSFKGVLVEATGLTIVSNGVGGAVSATAGDDTDTPRDSTFSTGPTLTAQDYLLAVVGNSSNTGLYFETTGGTGKYDGSNSYSSPTDPTDASTNAGYKYSIYCTYTTGPSAPTVTTQAVSDIAGTTATGNGNVTSDGGASITERGVCWNTGGTPTTSDSKATASGTTGAYTASITGLSVSTLYYVRAYAINSVGTSYGDQVNFTTTDGKTRSVYTSNGTFTVPAGVTSVTVKAWGGGGGGGGGGSGAAGGVGAGAGFIQADLSVTPAEDLTIVVGGGGGAGTFVTNTGKGGGGGGHSSVNRTTTTLVTAAGGGGGGGGDNSATYVGGAGGVGGAATGGSGGNGFGTVTGGSGGQQASGGAAGVGNGSPTAGSSLTGGNGGHLAGTTISGGTNGGGTGGGNDTSAQRGGGGGGGAGYYGGGGGGGSNAANTSGAGGGGGSNYVSGTNTTSTAGSGQTAANTGDVDYASEAGKGGSAGSISGNGGSGNGGRVVIIYTPATSKIKKFMGIEQAKLKKISGIAIASVKKLVGVANT